jgi:hypothetical protein
MMPFGVTREDGFTVGTDRAAVECSAGLVARQFAPATQIPHLQCPVIRRGDCALPVRRHCHAVNITYMSDEGSQLAPTRQSPQLSVVSHEADTAPWPSGVTATA